MFDPEAFDDFDTGWLVGPSYPFWRNNGATDIFRELLDEIVRTFKLLFEEGHILAKELAAHEKDEVYFHCLNMYGSTPDGGKDPRENFWNLDNRLERFARAAIVMAAIDLEASVNQFCFYSLGEVATEAIESLSLVGKLEVIHKVLGLTAFKGTSQYAAVRSLVRWRNAFVHGKCTDMPTHSIKENHTVLPKNFLDSMDIIGEALEYIRHYFVVFTHLNTISKHPYTELDFVQFYLSVSDRQGRSRTSRSCSRDSTLVVFQHYHLLLPGKKLVTSVWRASHERPKNVQSSVPSFSHASSHFPGTMGRW